MKYYEILFSPTGGTKKVADILMNTLCVESIQIDLMDREADFAAQTFQPQDVCLAAVPSFGGRVPAVAMERLGKLKGNGARVVLVAVYGNRAYEDTLLELEDGLKAAGFRPIAAVAAVAEHSILRQFAAGRPDQADRRELEAFGAEIAQRIQNDTAPEHLGLPGNRPYHPFGGVPLTPQGTRSCTGCETCAKLCPVGAIDPERPRQTDKARCISCMACVAACPEGARKVRSLLVAASAKMLKKACADRKANELF